MYLWSIIYFDSDFHTLNHQCPSEFWLACLWWQSLAVYNQTMLVQTNRIRQATRNLWWR